MWQKIARQENFRPPVGQDRVSLILPWNGFDSQKVYFDEEIRMIFKKEGAGPLFKDQRVAVKSRFESGCTHSITGLNNTQNHPKL